MTQFTVIIARPKIVLDTFAGHGETAGAYEICRVNTPTSKGAEIWAQKRQHDEDVCSLSTFGDIPVVNIQDYVIVSTFADHLYPL